MTDTDSPVQLSREDWRVILTRTVHEYRIHQVIDLASALTYNLHGGARGLPGAPRPPRPHRHRG